MFGRERAIDLIVGVIANVNGVYRFHDMDGDGKAGEKILDDAVAGSSDADRVTDYVWIHPDTGAVHCWLNKYPHSWVKAGLDGKLADGRGRSESIFLAVCYLTLSSFTSN